MCINVPDSSHMILHARFAKFTHTTENSWEHPCPNHKMLYTIGWRFDGTEGTITWGKYQCQCPISL